jgi:hypothetical protein
VIDNSEKELKIGLLGPKTAFLGQKRTL